MLSFADLSYLVTVIISVSVIYKGEFPGLFRKVSYNYELSIVQPISCHTMFSLH